jgi:hypothetical protein
MERFGFWKFCLFCLGMLAAVALAFRLLKLIYQVLFGSPLPSGLTYLLLGGALMICLASFAYRYSYDGHERMNQPALYDSVCGKLLYYYTFGLFLTLVILWQSAGMWWGFAWLGVYFGGEILISSVSEKRVLAERLWQAKTWFPDMSLAEQTARAIAWTKSGLEPGEYELQNRK